MPAPQDTGHEESRALLPPPVVFWEGVPWQLLGKLELLVACWTTEELGVGSRGAWGSGHGPQQVAVFLLSITSCEAGAWFCLFFSSLLKNSFTVITALPMFERQVSAFRATAHLKKQPQWFRRRRRELSVTYFYFFFNYDYDFFFSFYRHPLQPYLLITEELEQPGRGESPRHHHFLETAMSVLYDGLGEDSSSLRP